MEPLDLLPRTGRVDQGTTRELRLLGFTGCIKGILNSLSGGAVRREGSRSLSPAMESGYLARRLFLHVGGCTRPPRKEGRMKRRRKMLFRVIAYKMSRSEQQVLEVTSQ